MGVGSIQTVVVCVPATAATAAQQAACGKVGAQFYVPAKVQAYLLDPSQKNNLDAALEPFNYSYASGLWALAFGTVVGLYFVAHGIGLVLGFIRRG
ncbi:hypothetical protein [Undibacterium danionis]|uniref:Uncharacterized protein n=1 Tax=Undibacterium danionis TaxID=1812100 RepID=A0ABV6IEB9_9BURK